MNRSIPKAHLLVALLGILPLAALAGTEVYVPLGGADAIAVVDADSDRVVAEIPGIEASHGLAVSWDGEHLLAGSLLERNPGAAPSRPEGMSEAEHASHHGRPSAATTGRGTVYLIDAGERRLLQKIEVPGAVHHALITPNGRFGVVTHPGRGSVSVVDLSRRRLERELATGPAPNYVVSRRDGSRVYVSNTGGGTVTEIDTGAWRVVRTLPAGTAPEHLVLSPDERHLYAVDPAGGRVVRLDLEAGRVTATYPVGRAAHGVDLSDDGRLLYATSKEEGRLVAFNLASGTRRTVPLTPTPYHVTTIRGTGRLYVSSRNAPKLWVLDQQSLAVKGEIPIRGTGHEMGVVNR